MASMADCERSGGSTSFPCCSSVSSSAFDLPFAEVTGNKLTYLSVFLSRKSHIDWSAFCKVMQMVKSFRDSRVMNHVIQHDTSIFQLLLQFFTSRID